MKLCSACLLGVNCRFNGKEKPNKKVINLAKKEILIPVCPEQLGGLATPRLGAVIKNGLVLNTKGDDLTLQFKHGAQEVLKIAKLYNIKKAILKQRSPSCGCGQIYDGSFSKNIIKGNGITTDLLIKNNISVISEEEL